MRQSFDCNCGTPSCLGRITGARDLSLTALAGYWLNAHIWELLEDQRKFSRETKSGHEQMIDDKHSRHNL